MTKINILDSSIYNLISAGEVVSNPAGAIKELIENSLDANATQITIEIEDAGLSLIRISDNGDGIEKEDMEKVFMQHATSKIKDVDDIYKVSTLGFRGEAVASIALVSRIGILSKTKNDEIGHYMKYEAGKKIEEGEKATSNGTVVGVTGLFFNTPARFKFLRDVSGEQREITKLISHLILSKPNVSFSYYVNGQLKMSSNGKDLDSAVFNVYGAEFLNDAIKVDKSYENYKLYGFVCAPYNCKSNTSHQNIFVNGRSVTSDCVSSAIMSAYSDFLMKGKYPCYVLNLDLPFDEVDVNVAPQKNIVKFNKEAEIYNWIYEIVRNVLVKNESQVEEQELNEILDKAVEDETHSRIMTVGTQFSYNENKSYKEIFEKLNPDFEEADLNNVIKRSDSKVEIPLFESTIAKQENETSNQLQSSSDIMLKVREYSEGKVKQQMSQESFVSKANKIIGSAFNTYIIVEQETNLFMIDQHAAHERFLFDKYMAEIDNREVVKQHMLVPYILNVSLGEKIFIENNIQKLEEMGFEIESFGEKAFKVESVPLILSDLSLQDFFDEILGNIEYLMRENETLKNKIATKACKNAIKGGYVLVQSEIDKILDMVENSKSPLLCPHGRPYVVKITENDIEKWFRRIV